MMIELYRKNGEPIKTFAARPSSEIEIKETLKKNKRIFVGGTKYLVDSIEKLNKERYKVTVTDQ